MSRRRRLSSIVCLRCSPSVSLLRAPFAHALTHSRTLSPVHCTAVSCSGFQYVRVTPYGNGTESGFEGTLDSIVGLEIHTNMSAVGSLSFGGDGKSDSVSERAAAVLGGIQSMTLQSQRTNVAAYMPTDCPTVRIDG